MKQNRLNGIGLGLLAMTLTAGMGFPPEASIPTLPKPLPPPPEELKDIQPQAPEGGSETVLLTDKDGSKVAIPRFTVEAVSKMNRRQRRAFFAKQRKAAGAKAGVRG